MDSLYTTYLSRDPQLKVKNKVELPIVKGSPDYTQQSVFANSQSTSEIDFSFTPPSEGVFVSRKALIKYKFEFSTTIVADANIPNATNVFSPGSSVCIQSYPLHRVSTHCQTIINNAQVDMNVPETLTAFLQMADEEDMREYQTLVPIMSDRYARYSDVVSANSNNPFLGYEQAYDKRILPRGCHNITITSVTRTPGAGGGNDDSLVKTNNADQWVIIWEITCVEPILVAPFCAGRFGEEADAFLGVNRLNIKYNISSNARRVLSSNLTGGTVTTTLTGVKDSTLFVQYKTSCATGLIPERIVHPFYQTYTYTNSNYSTLASGASATFQFSNLQLGEVPKLVALYARKRLDTCSARDPDSVLPGSDLSVSFNTRTSLLNQFSVSELFLISKRNGLNNVDFYQFLGLASKYNAGYVAGANGTDNNLDLSGGLFLLDPAKDLSISNPFITDGSTGQFNLSWSATFKNNTASVMNVELVTVLFNTRLLETASGYSRIIQPTINQQMVTSAIEAKVEGSDLPNNMMMGGRMDKVVAKGISGGEFGGSRSGGSRSGGIKSKLDSLLM